MGRRQDLVGYWVSAVREWSAAAWQRRRLVAGAVVVLALAVMVPPDAWTRLWTDAPRLGWRWLPLAIAIGGSVVLIERIAAGWRHGGRGSRQPVAERIPLFVHVAALLAMATLVAATSGFAIWAVLGRPDLSGSAGLQRSAWTVANTFDALKIVLAVVAGIGGVVALTVAYRKQDHGEAAEQRENTKLSNERFGRAADQLGSDKAAVRLAGVYAMAGLADDWAGGRQTCIDVLCGYLRAPYDPPAQPEQGNAAREQQQVRHTVIRLIRDHLTPAVDGVIGGPRWHGYRFDLRGATFDGGDFSAIVVPKGTLLDLSGAEFSTGTANFLGATFSGGVVDFGGAKFAGGVVDFSAATFSAGTVNHTDATFSGSTVNYRSATFSGSTVNFVRATFSGGVVDFSGARFAGSPVDYGNATFSGGVVDFSSAKFYRSPVDFIAATFSGGTVNYRYAIFSGGSASYLYATFSGGAVDFSGAAFSGGTVHLGSAKFAGSTVDFRDPRDWSSPPTGVGPGKTGVIWPDAEAA